MDVCNTSKKYSMINIPSGVSGYSHADLIQDGASSLANRISLLANKMKKKKETNASANNDFANSYNA